MLGSDPIMGAISNILTNIRKEKCMSDNDLMENMASDGAAVAGGVVASTEKLAELGTLCKSLQEKESEIKGVEEALKILKEQARELSSNKIPDLFDEIGMSEIKLRNGEKVTIKRGFASTISQANKEEAFAWLHAKGHAAIIKHELTTTFKEGDADEKKALEAKLNELGLTYKDKDYVHHSTLKSFVKEQIENGSDIPQDAFGVFPTRETKIKIK